MIPSMLKYLCILALATYAVSHTLATTAVLNSTDFSQDGNHDDYEWLTESHVALPLATPTTTKLKETASSHMSMAGQYDRADAAEIVAAQPYAFVTVVCRDEEEAGVTILHESLLRAGHRESLVVITSPYLNNSVRARIARLPFVLTFRSMMDDAAAIEMSYVVSDNMRMRGGNDAIVKGRGRKAAAAAAAAAGKGEEGGDICKELTLCALALPGVDKAVVLPVDAVVLQPLRRLAAAPVWTAVRNGGSAGGATNARRVMVLPYDENAFRTARAALCTTRKRLNSARPRRLSASAALRRAAPGATWLAASDDDGVPARHLSAAWYQVRVLALVHFPDGAPPWAWWRSPSSSRMVPPARALAVWCEYARSTAFACASIGDASGRHQTTATIMSAERNAKLSSHASLPPPSPPMGPSPGHTFVVLMAAMWRPSWAALARYYAGMSAVARVIVIWQGSESADKDDNDGDGSGDSDSEAEDEKDVPPAPARKVVVWRAARNSLNERFDMRALLVNGDGGGGTPGVYVCDDDVRVDETDLVRAFHIWRNHPRRLVGFFPRRWGARKPFYSMDVRGGYNIALTKGVFVHCYYIYLYASLLPKSITDVVDTYHNCEDILLNVMVTAVTGLAPLHVSTRKNITDAGQGSGLSARPSHLIQRERCVRELIQKFDLKEAPLMVGSYSEKVIKNVERV